MPRAAPDGRRWRLAVAVRPRGRAGPVLSTGPGRGRFLRRLTPRRSSPLALAVSAVSATCWAFPAVCFAPSTTLSFAVAAATAAPAGPAAPPRLPVAGTSASRLAAGTGARLAGSPRTLLSTLAPRTLLSRLAGAEALSDTLELPRSGNRGLRAVDGRLAVGVNLVERLAGEVDHFQRQPGCEARHAEDQQAGGDLGHRLGGTRPRTGRDRCPSRRGRRRR